MFLVSTSKAVASFLCARKESWRPSNKPNFGGLKERSGGTWVVGRWDGALRPRQILSRFLKG
jgi:hypothetical protein